MLTSDQIRALFAQLEANPPGAIPPLALSETIARIRCLLDDLEAGRMRSVVGLSLIQHHAFHTLPAEAQFCGLHELLPGVEQAVMSRYGDRLPAHLRTTAAADAGAAGDEGAPDALASPRRSP